ncbi:MAG: uridylate kinase [Rhodospirillales bacterium]|nr:uridylate kinase [Rhodospirillales bacterium]
MSRPAQRPLWIVKLGGSLAGWPDLRRWVRLLGETHAVDLVVVPGGGPFADQVRAAQARWRFDDAAAHRMAILAMEQYGLMLASLSRGRMICGASPAAIRKALRDGVTPVWSPGAMCFADMRGARQIAQTWDMTSDSLAAWLAGRLRADHLVLVKSAPPPRGADMKALVRRGLVDRAFPRYAAAGRFGLSVVWREDRAGMRRAFRTGVPPVSVQLPR